MKTKKRVMCSGLAFEDQEDMEMLHQYALEGWIFREMKGLWYVLYKEEPQDLIFSYTISKVKKEDMDDFVHFFAEGGWHRIPSKDDTNHFFYASSGTPPLHTSKETRAEEYRPICKTAIRVTLISAVVLILTLPLFSKPWLGLLPILALMLCAGGLTLAVGSWRRTKGKYFLQTKMTFWRSVGVTLLGILLLVIAVSLHLPKLPRVWLMMLGSGMTCGGGVWILFTYRQFRDKKEVIIKKKDEGLL